MKNQIYIFCFLIAVFAGCASGPQRTIKYRVPQFQYEQHEPEFTHDPLK